MLKKAVLLLLVVIASFNAMSQTTTPKAEGFDTLKTLTGCIYVSDSTNFTTASAYLHRVDSYYWDYEPPAGFKKGDTTVTLKRVKKYVSRDYYIEKLNSADKKQWFKVNVLADFNIDLRKK